MLCLDEAGPPIATEQNALDHLIGEALGHGASMVAVPASRLDAAFFALRTGLAGGIAQKITNSPEARRVRRHLGASPRQQRAARLVSGFLQARRDPPSLGDLAADARPVRAE
ncbi:DUF4180 domain-containing protein [Ralstonia pickettii]|uniref:DUF4180 domain-containing protein n=1 Tax=Ralstonia pickettii TaxID=329 RepID=UPI0034657042